MWDLQVIRVIVKYRQFPNKVYFDRPISWRVLFSRLEFFFPWKRVRFLRFSSGVNWSRKVLDPRRCLRWDIVDVRFATPFLSHRVYLWRVFHCISRGNIGIDEGKTTVTRVSTDNWLNSMVIRLSYCNGSWVWSSRNPSSPIVSFCYTYHTLRCFEDDTKWMKETTRTRVRMLIDYSVCSILCCFEEDTGRGMRTTRTRVLHLIYFIRLICVLSFAAVKQIRMEEGELSRRRCLTIRFVLL